MQTINKIHSTIRKTIPPMIFAVLLLSLPIATSTYSTQFRAMQIVHLCNPEAANSKPFAMEPPWQSPLPPWPNINRPSKRHKTNNKAPTTPDQHMYKKTHQNLIKQPSNDEEFLQDWAKAQAILTTNSATVANITNSVTVPNSAATNSATWNGNHTQCPRQAAINRLTI